MPIFRPPYMKTGVALIRKRRQARINVPLLPKLHPIMQAEKFHHIQTFEIFNFIDHRNHLVVLKVGRSKIPGSFFPKIPHLNYDSGLSKSSILWTSPATTIAALARLAHLPRQSDENDPMDTSRRRLDADECYYSGLYG